jgi:hypothetical protein
MTLRIEFEVEEIDEIGDNKSEQYYDFDVALTNSRFNDMLF